MGWRWCWWPVWRWRCRGCSSSSLLFFLQLCSPLFPLFPLSTLFFLLCSSFVEVLVAAACGRKMTVTGKSNDSSCLLLPRAEEQVLPFLQVVQRRVGGRWWAEAGWWWRLATLVQLACYWGGWLGWCWFPRVRHGSSSSPCGDPSLCFSSRLASVCFASLFLSPCFSASSSKWWF